MNTYSASPSETVSLPSILTSWSRPVPHGTPRPGRGSCRAQSSCGLGGGSTRWAHGRPRQGGWRAIIETLCSLKSSSWGKKQDCNAVCLDWRCACWVGGLGLSPIIHKYLIGCGIVSTAHILPSQSRGPQSCNVSPPAEGFSGCRCQRKSYALSPELGFTCLSQYYDLLMLKNDFSIRLSYASPSQQQERNRLRFGCGGVGLLLTCTLPQYQQVLIQKSVNWHILHLWDSKGILDLGRTWVECA